MEQFGFSMIEAQKMGIAPSNLGISKGTCPLANKHHSWKLSCQAVIKFYYHRCGPAIVVDQRLREFRGPVSPQRKTQIHNIFSDLSSRCVLKFPSMERENRQEPFI